MVTEENFLSFACSCEPELLPKSIWKWAKGVHHGEALEVSFIRISMFILYLSQLLPGVPSSGGRTWDTACGVHIVFADIRKPFPYEAKAVHITGKCPWELCSPPRCQPEGSALELLVHDKVETRDLMTLFLLVLTPNISAHLDSDQGDSRACPPGLPTEVGSCCHCCLIMGEWKEAMLSVISEIKEPF